jgi:hypothetical protein
MTNLFLGNTLQNLRYIFTYKRSETRMTKQSN